MLQNIANHAAGKVLKSDGFQISTEAKQHKKVDPSVIDGTLGTFYYDDGSFHTHNVVKMVMNSLVDEDIYLYSTSDGTKEFRESVIKYIFQDTLELLEKEMTIRAIPTPGGTGALTVSSYNSLDHGQTLLIPTPCWGPYVGIGKGHGFEVEKFFMFDGDAFNLKGFIEKCEQIIEKQGKVVALINDPCNNPTGYTMTREELAAVIEYMNSRKGVPFVLIYDCAYMDMAVEGMKETRKKLEVFANANENIVINVAFSASKTFFIYGQRLGAQIILSKNEKAVIDYFNAGNYYARNTWSNCNKGMVSLVSKVLSSEELMKDFKVELQVVIDELDKRAKLFLAEAKEIGLYTYPYMSGFFITIPCNNIEKVIEELKKDEKVYLLSVDGGVRVAICSLSMEDVKGLAAKIQRVISKNS